MNTRQGARWAATVCFLCLAVIPVSGRSQTADFPAAGGEVEKATSAQSDAAYVPPSDTALPARPPRRLWLTLAVVQHGAAVFDAWTTRRAVRSHRELNPLLRPFAHSAALYPAMQIAPLAADWGALRLARSRHGWMRRLWWVPQAGLTAGMIWSGIHNLRLQPPGTTPRQKLH